MGEEKLVAVDSHARRKPFASLDRPEVMEDAARLERHHMRGHAEIALPAARPRMKMRSRARGHRDTQEGGDRGDHDGHPNQRGHAANGYHCGFFLSAGGLSAGSSTSLNVIDVSAEYF